MDGSSILVVEDESVTALDIQQSLRRKGFHVGELACTGHEAIALARRHRPDLVLMDIQLRGEIDGIKAASLIRSELNIPVVFLTAFSDESTLRRASNAEPSAYLLKPFEETILAITIEVALNRHRLHTAQMQQKAEALENSENRFYQVAHMTSEVAVYLLDPVGHVLSWNCAAERIYGWSAGEMLSKHYSILYPPELVARAKPDLDLQAAIRASSHSEYGSQCRKDATKFSAEMTLDTLRDEQRRIAGFLRTTRETHPGGEGN